MGAKQFVEKALSIAGAKGIKQVDIARTADINPSRISEWKRDEGQPTLDQAMKIAKLLGVTVDFLLNESQEESDPIGDAQVVLLTELHTQLTVVRAQLEGARRQIEGLHAQMVTLKQAEREFTEKERFLEKQYDTLKRSLDEVRAARKSIVAFSPAQNEKGDGDWRAVKGVRKRRFYIPGHDREITIRLNRRTRQGPWTVGLKDSNDGKVFSDYNIDLALAELAKYYVDEFTGFRNSDYDESIGKEMRSNPEKYDITFEVPDNAPGTAALFRAD